MIDLELTPKIRQWLESDPQSRDLKAGAELLLRVTRNRILYSNIIRNPKAKASLLEYHLQKILKKRLIDTTHEEVKALMVQVDDIAARHNLSSSKRSEFQKGKRLDHDELPDDVKQLYVDNADLMRRMRDLHTRIRLINSQNSTCPDSDRYPLAKALIEYDRKYRDNWNIYDHYVKGTPIESTVMEVDSRTARKNEVKTLNLLLGKYAKSPSEKAAIRIKELYSGVVNPSATLQAKMAAAGLL